MLPDLSLQSGGDTRGDLTPGGGRDERLRQTVELPEARIRRPELTDDEPSSRARDLTLPRQSRLDRGHPSRTQVAIDTEAAARVERRSVAA
jgi:hypothetical protein